jgi:hypothetical protein
VAQTNPCLLRSRSKSVGSECLAIIEQVDVRVHAGASSDQEGLVVQAGGGGERDGIKPHAVRPDGDLGISCVCVNMCQVLRHGGCEVVQVGGAQRGEQRPLTLQRKGRRRMPLGEVGEAKAPVAQRKIEL